MRKPTNARDVDPYELVVLNSMLGGSQKFRKGVAFATKKEAMDWATGRVYIYEHPTTSEWLILWPR